jgi:hypothetical protein
MADQLLVVVPACFVAGLQPEFRRRFGFSLLVETRGECASVMKPICTARQAYEYSTFISGWVGQRLFDRWSQSRVLAHCS